MGRYSHWLRASKPTCAGHLRWPEAVVEEAACQAYVKEANIASRHFHIHVPSLAPEAFMIWLFRAFKQFGH